jgi:Domain of unknown function (DUF6894)
MPRYFFHMVEGDGRELVRDSQGLVLSGPAHARKEAVGLARDITSHGLTGSLQTWKITVTDENGNQVLLVPLSEISAASIWTRFEPAWLLGRLKSIFSLRPPSARFTAAAGLGIVMQAALMILVMITNPGGNYHTASAPTGDAVVAVRFARDASAEAIAEFVAKYNGSIIDRPQPGGFYRLRITALSSPAGNAAPPQEELAAIVSRMKGEKIVELAAAVE